ncbi:hypothetical protein Acr_28g0005510 [Actinidia rufa]|uniref:Reverse transcriptase Ty1/copia-type domain-containing protein n=1 Tax=Actinidia rufa TaxID=165716 RepID=A0A7J0H9U6_9ERIC|nr:hypothetical protein Acr_28g0005510 [Actinidia rufa]
MPYCSYDDGDNDNVVYLNHCQKLSDLLISLFLLHPTPIPLLPHQQQQLLLNRPLPDPFRPLPRPLRVDPLPQCLHSLRPQLLLALNLLKFFTALQFTVTSLSLARLVPQILRVMAQHKFVSPGPSHHFGNLREGVSKAFALDNYAIWLTNELASKLVLSHELNHVETIAETAHALIYSVTSVPVMSALPCAPSHTLLTLYLINCQASAPGTSPATSIPTAISCHISNAHPFIFWLLGPDHYKTDCPKNPTCRDPRPQSIATTAGVSSTTSASSMLIDVSISPWYFDSRCSNHMTSDLSIFSSKFSESSFLIIYTSNGSSMTIDHDLQTDQTLGIGRRHGRLFQLVHLHLPIPTVATTSATSLSFVQTMPKNTVILPFLSFYKHKALFPTVLAMPSSSSAPPYLIDPSIKLFLEDVDVPTVLLDDAPHVAPPATVYPVESPSTDSAPLVARTSYPSTCQSAHGIVLLIFYVDDMIIIGDDAHGIFELKDFFHRYFEMKDIGPLTYFLGLDVSSAFTDILLLRPSMPRISLPVLDFQILIGSLIYLIVTHLDIAHTVHLVTQFMFAPRSSHYAAIHCILCTVHLHVSSADQTANSFTKSLPPGRFDALVTKLKLLSGLVEEDSSIELKSHCVNLVLILKQVGITLKIMCALKGLNFEIWVCGKVPKQVIGDEMRITQAILTMVLVLLKFDVNGASFGKDYWKLQ